MDEMNQQRNNKKKLLLTLIPVLVLVVAVVGVTYAFFNYTRAGSDNSIGTGRINFVSTQSGTTSISNYFPQIPGGAQASQSSTATITVTGGTTFSGGINYYVKLIDVKVGNNAYNPETDVPVYVDVAEVSGLTVANRGTFTPEGTNHSGVGIALSEGVIIANGTIGVADTAANSDNWINGTFTVQAYIPSNVAISDTTGESESTAYVNGTTTEWVAERRVLTTAQWNALSANPVTFKIQVVANEGKLPNTMSLSSNSGTIAPGESTTVTINTTGDGAKTCSTSDNTKATCSINENTLTINGVAEGTATITVNQAASAGYTAASATYTATVEIPVITITYNANGGTIATASKTIAPDSTAYGELAEPTPDTGYLFAGWYTEANGGTPVTSTTAFTNSSATTLYAHYALESSIKCKRVTNVANLNTETCNRSSNYCADDGYTGSNTTITYGNAKELGSELTVGDAFDCKVSTTGGYTERFYYVSPYYNTNSNNGATALTFDDISNNNSYATLIYYKNFVSGSPSDGGAAYDAVNNNNWHGPVTALTHLPTTSTWSNVALKTTTRAILAENGSTHNATSTSGGTLPTAFSYSDYAARLLTAQELMNGCGLTGVEYNTTGVSTRCKFLFERTQYANTSTYLYPTYGPWLETPQASNSDCVWIAYAGSRGVSNSDANYTTRGVRPAIDVPVAALLK